MSELYSHVLRLLGCSLGSQEIRELSELVSLPKVTQIELIQRSLRERGISLLHMNEIVYGVLFHIKSDSEEILPYLGILPFDIATSDPEELAEQKIGVAPFSVNTVIGKFTRRIYQLPDFYIMLEFDLPLRQLKTVCFLRMNEIELSLL